MIAIALRRCDDADDRDEALLGFHQVNQNESSKSWRSHQHLSKRLDTEIPMEEKPSVLASSGNSPTTTDHRSRINVFEQRNEFGLLSRKRQWNTIEAPRTDEYRGLSWKSWIGVGITNVRQGILSHPFSSTIYFKRPSHHSRVSSCC